VNDETAKWFVVRTNQHKETFALAALAGDHVPGYLPMILRERKGGVCGVSMFPSYLFVHLPLASDLWRKVFTARYVNTVLTWGGRVRPIADRVIDEIKAREHDGFVRMSLDAPVAHRFERGQVITLKKGAFAALPVIFQEPIDERRCWVLIQLLGESARMAKADLSHLAA
jgi:transcription antitermination factor NusG